MPKKEKQQLPTICVGCGRLSNEPLDPNNLACCPENKYIPIKQYWLHSTYKYENQIGNTYRKPVDEWVNENRSKISKRLTLCLQRIKLGSQNRHFTYMDEITKDKFMRIRGNGEKAWNELNTILIM